MNEIWAVVPVKCLTDSKQRLKGVLTSTERAELMGAMVRDVLTALQDVAGLDGVLVATRSAEVSGIASQFGAEVFVESVRCDQSQAVTEANRHLIDRYRAQASLMVPGDVPLITADDVNDLIALHENVTLVPDSAGKGTNALMTSPPNAISLHFGKGSLRLHVDSARAAGLSPLVLVNEHFARDIDSPADLYRAVPELPASYTRSYLEHSDIGRRLQMQRPDGEGVSVCL
jgi:2-phospho-L-lactate guanylyltransferase